jgi:hypothetical protein
MATQKARQEFIDIIEIEANLADRRIQVLSAVSLAKLLLRHGATYARLQEANCNGVGNMGRRVERIVPEAPEGLRSLL